MIPTKRIRFKELVYDIKPVYMSFSEAVTHLEYAEDIICNEAGLKKLEAHWAEILEQRVLSSARTMRESIRCGPLHT